MLLVINAVGLTPRLLPFAPRLQAVAAAGWMRPLRDVLPSVTCTAQATLLTGAPPNQHGIVANGWLWRETGEVRFWLQSNRLIQAEPLYKTAARRAKRRGRPFRCAKLFWWFNQGAPVAISVTPKPHYGADGNKAFGIHGTPLGLTDRLQRTLSPFPFASFWGPMAGLPCTQWIAHCAAEILREERPDLTLVYLPHLDYDPQRYGPPHPNPSPPRWGRGVGVRGCDMKKLVGELDTACAPLLDAARAAGARVWIVSEYGHVPVSRPLYLNRVLRKADLLTVRSGPFGETPDLFNSRAFAVCDHQLAHIYVPDADDRTRVRDVLAGIPGVARVYTGEERAEIQLDHERSGDLIALSEPDAWFAYPFWLDDRAAPDYARTVDIHRKPGYDPCELLFDPALRWPKGRAAWRLLQKKLGFRTLFDVVPLDATLVRGSHGLVAQDANDGPLLIADGPAPNEGMLPMTALRDWVLAALDLPEE
jgi:predicted AlkP superfamily pyrophosphatase or phosphodiesterase